ncbi:PP2C family protein-serine/threonine phosphatase [Tropicimonas marinistellae]|uniref:PP2C family protein-serine/threonine phosphatase n=1 Tax=Tropicimonas marinistellae TaxID=1739787 RepID=UPI000832504F|nr:protein phosphatase 2C domain-containing protein [Tropicimonas marinistellae]
MQQHSEPFFEAASAVSVGKRTYQEDAVLFDCPLGSDTGLVVLSDGMGGHAAGDVASKIVLTEVFSELKLQSGASEAQETGYHGVLTRAARGANDCIRAYIEDRPESLGMGATLVAGVLQGDALHWISIGDSPLYLFRGGVLQRLNEEHSFGHTMDSMVASGLMESEDAAQHPDRNCLTSVVGGGGIAEIDCPEEPFRLLNGDLLVFASDGIEYLSNERIRTVLADWSTMSSGQIAAQLLREIEKLDDPDQDNVSIVVVKIQLVETPAIRGNRPHVAPRPVVPARPTSIFALKTVDTGKARAHKGRRQLKCDTP